jgi:hypothetical protein
MVCLSLAIAPKVNAQDMPRATGLQNLFEQSEGFLNAADALCDTERCHTITKMTHIYLQHGEDQSCAGTLTEQNRALWHAQYGLYLLQVQHELILLAQENGATVSDSSLMLLPDASHRKCNPVPAVAIKNESGHLVRVTELQLQMCDRTFAAATGICALYAALGPAGGIPGAICEAAAIYGYNQCLQAASVQP